MSTYYNHTKSQGKALIFLAPSSSTKSAMPEKRGLKLKVNHDKYPQSTKNGPCKWLAPPLWVPDFTSSHVNKLLSQY